MKWSENRATEQVGVVVRRPVGPSMHCVWSRILVYCSIDLFTLIIQPAGACIFQHLQGIVYWRFWFFRLSPRFLRTRSPENRHTRSKWNEVSGLAILFYRNGDALYIYRAQVIVQSIRQTPSIYSSIHPSIYRPRHLIPSATVARKSAAGRFSVHMPRTK